MKINWSAALLTSLSSLCFTTGALRFTSSTPLLATLCALIAIVQYFILDRLHRVQGGGGSVLREVEDLLHSISVRLSQGMSLEAALRGVAQLHQGKISPLLIKASRELEAGHTAEEVLSRILQRVRVGEVERLLLLVPRLSSYSSQRAGSMLLSVVELLERNRAVKERLESVIKREEFKVHVLSTLYPMVLAALYLVLQVASQLTGPLKAIDLLSLNLSLASLSAVAPFYATLMVTRRGGLVRSMLSLSIYVSIQVVLAALLPLSSLAGFLYAS